MVKAGVLPPIKGFDFVSVESVIALWVWYRKNKINM